MDPRLETALSDVDHIHTINNQKRLLKEKYQEDVVLFYNGGKFTVTNELLGFVNSIVSLKLAYITDDNDIPVIITSPQEFSDNVIKTYRAATETYYNAYYALESTSRNLESSLSL